MDDADADRQPRDRRLAFLVACFGVLVTATQVGSIMAPTIVKGSPELLLALSSRIRHLLFAVPAGINPVSYSLIGFGRLFAAGALCFALGHGYGVRGMAWVERQFADQTPATFRWMQRAADRAGPLLVVVMPGSNIVCALVGYRRMRTSVFATCLAAGIAFRLTWVWLAAKQFEDQLTSALDWIDRYQWWLVVGFFAITFLQSWRRAASSSGPPSPPDRAS
ncbi:MAG: hypothetical protein AB7Q42_19100 [Acidimicrobiia bacterium]